VIRVSESVRERYEPSSGLDRRAEMSESAGPRALAVGIGDGGDG